MEGPVGVSKMPRDPHQAILRVLLADADVSLIGSGQRGWSSATFQGARHSFRLRATTCEIPAGLAGISEQLFAIDGHIVADIAVTGHDADRDGSVIRIEALTVEAE